ncbi:MAG: tRNA lysidine(34) synthetase TilS [Ruminococcaceae bacterium]|nr:tRNA lysidine(34) synthetase TilS [Oscillospiraceae bacterium]
MLDKVIRAVDRYEMFSSAQNVTVALSGGADSVCLLYALKEIEEKYSLNLSAVHINHLLRGEESFRDEEFVKNLCAKLCVPLKVFRVDVNAESAKTGESTELCARRLRYEIFARESKGVVATAHSADDNLETVIFNLTRGSGIKGLCGIPPVRDIFVRPLILCSRKEIEEFLNLKEIEFVTDSTNLTDNYTRNYIRHNTVSTLRKINPSVEQTVSIMSENLREDEDFLTSTANKIYLLCSKADFLDAELLSVQHPSIIKRVIALFIKEKTGISCDSFHLESCKQILLFGGRTSLPENLSAVCLKNRFYIEGEQNEPTFTYKVEIKEDILQKDIKINNLFLNNHIDCDKINGSLKVRTRFSSDEIRLRGRNCTKSLKKLFSELKIPENLRQIIPVASDDSGVVWIYGVGVSERVKVDFGTTKAAEFIVTKVDNDKISGDVNYDRE